MAHFRARARTVDLLGRQQIAGIPTAIHELFKNAHDAYADHVDVDYFRRDRLFVLRDDGLGMTKSDFEERWLVVGTESKVPSARAGPPRDPKKPLRPIMGEKGIGRLAAGILGDQVLILSRARRDGETRPLVAAFVHWAIFSAPGIDLADVHVPVRTYADGNMPDSAEVIEMTREFGECVKHLADQQRVSTDLNRQIQKDLLAFRFDPRAQERALPGSDSLRLSEGGQGTQFWVFPAAETIAAELEPSGDKASRIEQQLLGFSNQMTPNAPAPVLQTAFRDHRSATDIHDIIAADRFLEPGEMQNADHYISGSVDGYGQFRGTVSIFGERRDYVIPFRGTEATACGPFELHLAYVQGELRDTTLPDQDWLRFIDKAKRLGGVYVYVDGVRVLPYGNVDFDWLEIEERRSKGLTYYFYSHRRMCGAVLLTRDSNARLAEKAGREGFIRNQAYLDLQAVIVGILLRTAAEFFRKDGVYTERFELLKKAHARAKAAAERRAKTVRARRKGFQDTLVDISERLGSGECHAKVADVRAALSSSLDGLKMSSDKFADLLKLEASSHAAVETIRQTYRVTRPRVALPKGLEREWRRHENQFAELDSQLLVPFEREIAELIALAYAVHAEQATIPYARRFVEVMTLNCEERDAEVVQSRKGLLNAVEAAGKYMRSSSDEMFAAARDSVARLQADLPRMATKVANDADFNREQQAAIRELQARTADYVGRASAVQEQLEALSWEPGDDLLEQLAAVEQEREDLRERLDDELEAVQLGMTVEVISHEFDHHIRHIRDLLRALSKWGQANRKLAPLVDDVRSAFEHLDGYLALFTPLHRRLYRSTSVFTGRDIEVYLRRLFGGKLESADIQLVVSEAFRSTTIVGYPSTYYPIFVNLVDNAIWWLNNRGRREIVLDADSTSLSVRDSGPGIAAGDRELVFERGFSLKPAGRGLGLTIARDSIRGIGGDLVIDDVTQGSEFRLLVPDGTIQVSGG